MKKLIITLIAMIFVGSVNASVIDSMWINQNDANSIEICYELQSIENKSFTVNAEYSLNNGINWQDGSANIKNGAGNIGDNIKAGTHCFNWDYEIEPTLKNDLVFKISLVSPQVWNDDFSILDNERYVINGNDGYVDSEEGVLVLTENKNWRNGRLFANRPVFNDNITVELDFRMLPGDCDLDHDKSGADGISIVFSRFANPQDSPGNKLGIIGTDGWGIVVDNFDNLLPFDLNGNHIEISSDSMCFYQSGNYGPKPHLQAAIGDEIIDGEWHHLKAIISYPTITVLLDNNIYINGDFPELEPFNAFVGISGATGRCYCGQSIDNLIITRNVSSLAVKPFDNSQVVHRYSHTFDIKSDWNLLSYPFSDEVNYKEIFPFALPPVVEFDNKEKNYTNIETLRSGTGFWLLSPVDTTLTVTRENLRWTITNTLYPGWNIIGAPAEPIDTKLFRHYIELNFPIYGYNTEKRQYYPAEKMEPGNGYYLFANDTVYVQIPY